MYILHSVDPQANIAFILDTSTKRLNKLVLQAIAKKVNEGLIRVYGFRNINKATEGCVKLPAYNICVCLDDAKIALIDTFIAMGMTKAQAEAQVQNMKLKKP